MDELNKILWYLMARRCKLVNQREDLSREINWLNGYINFLEKILPETEETEEE